MGPKSNDWCLFVEKREGDAETQGREGHVMMEQRKDVMLLQAKEHQRLLVTNRRSKEGFFSRSFRENMAPPIGLLASRLEASVWSLWQLVIAVTVN